MERAFAQIEHLSALSIHAYWEYTMSNYTAISNESLVVRYNIRKFKRKVYRLSKRWNRSQWGGSFQNYSEMQKMFSLINITGQNLSCRMVNFQLQH